MEKNIITYEIEKGIPMPLYPPDPRRYPFNEMEVGDSFFVPMEDGTKLKPATSQYAFRSGKKFTTKRENGGIRIWRVL